MAHPDGPYIDRDPDFIPIDPKQAIIDGKNQDAHELIGILSRVSRPEDSPQPYFPHLPPHPPEEQYQGEIVAMPEKPNTAPFPEDTVPLIDLYLVAARGEDSGLDLTPSLARPPTDTSIGKLVENILEEQRPANLPARAGLVKAQLEPPPLHPSISTDEGLTLATARIPANQVLVSDPGPVGEVRKDITDLHENKTIYDARLDAVLFWQHMITLQEFLRSGTQMPIRVYVPLKVLGDFQPHEIAVSAMHPGLAKRSSASPSQPS